ncbi:MAG: hypothetical protein FJ290_18375 [Planctomycetes bacterium]|nr:hypothetical protein [Planctomycetota bacterium]
MSSQVVEQADAVALRREVEGLCGAARGEVFEDGMESRFSRALLRLIEEHEDVAVRELQEAIEGGRVDAPVAAEALRWLGLMGQGPAYRRRRRLLEEALSADCAEVRDGAVLGVMYLDDPHALGDLRGALARESQAWLRRGMEQAIQQLARE